MRSKAIVDRVGGFVNLLPKASYDRPAQKFVRDAVFGMMESQSLVVTEIARALSDGNSHFKANYKRVIRRLGEVNLEPAMMQQQARALDEVSDDTIVAIDIGDVAKPYSNELECLDRVADGSDGHVVKNGYGLIGAVAVNPWTEDKTPAPLELRLYSTRAEGWVSENALMKEVISDIHGRTGGMGIHTIDRGGDRGIILTHLFDLRQRFIVRMNRRHLTGEDDRIIDTAKREIVRGQLPYVAKIQRQADENDRARSELDLRFDFEPVKVTALTAKGVAHECWLVTAWALGRQNPIQLLTTVRVETTEDALKIITGYLSRWSVEETYRFVKSGLGLESMRCFSYGKLQNLVRLAYIVSSLIARMVRFSSWRAVFRRVALRLKKAPDHLYNWLYRGADACAELCRKHRAAILAANRPILSRRRPPLEQLGLFSAEFDQ